MTVGELDAGRLRGALAGEGLDLETGPFVTRIRSTLDSVRRGLQTLYADFPAAEGSGFADFHVRVAASGGVRRWFRPQARFFVDGRSIFKPLARHQAFPMLEWGLNWCVAGYAHHYVMFHAAVVAKRGRAALLAAPPGAGKSTLCAALVSRGWRLLSDETALLDPETGLVHGMARPVSLKNESIDAVRAFAPDAFISPPCRDTVKGAVAHMRPPADSVARMREPARPAWLIFPRFEPGAATRLSFRDKGSAFMRLVTQSFNYAALGRTAFERTADLLERSRTYDFVYSRLDDAVETLGRIEPPAR